MSTARVLLREPVWWAALGVLLAAALILGLLVAPPDAVQGESQRLMYLHVPAAWCAYLCFALVLAGSVADLVRRRDGADRLARAAAEVGVVLTAVTLVTGSLWGAATWGTGWVWDARISSTVAMGLVYLAYLGLRAASPGRRLPAAVGVAGFAIVPIVHFSVLWWRTLHQPPTILAPSLAPPLDARMGLALLVAVLALTLGTACVLRRRVAALRRRAESAASPPVSVPAVPVRR